MSAHFLVKDAVFSVVRFHVKCSERDTLYQFLYLEIIQRDAAWRENEINCKHKCFIIFESQVIVYLIG